MAIWFVLKSEMDDCCRQAEAVCLTLPNEASTELQVEACFYL